jgi:hypothetical protein
MPCDCERPAQPDKGMPFRKTPTYSICHSQRMLRSGIQALHCSCGPLVANTPTYVLPHAQQPQPPGAGGMQGAPNPYGASGPAPSEPAGYPYQGGAYAEPYGGSDAAGASDPYTYAAESESPDVGAARGGAAPPPDATAAAFRANFRCIANTGELWARIVPWQQDSRGSCGGWTSPPQPVAPGLLLHHCNVLHCQSCMSVGKSLSPCTFFLKRS